MSDPSAVVAAIVARLSTLLGSSITVEAHDGTFEGKDFVTAGNAGVLVTCLGLPLDYEMDSEPPLANAEFAAFCLVNDQAADGTKGRGDIAMDLAGLVASHVQRERWSSTASGRAQKVRAQNLHNATFREKGIGVWAVRWTQSIELTPPDVDGLLVRLAGIDTTISRGDADTPDVGHSIDFPEE